MKKYWNNFALRKKNVKKIFGFRVHNALEYKKLLIHPSDVFPQLVKWREGIM